MLILGKWQAVILWLKNHEKLVLCHTLVMARTKHELFFQQFANVYRLTFEDLYPHSLRQFSATQKFSHCGIVVAQLVEQLLLTPEVQRSVARIQSLAILLTVSNKLLRKDDNKEKRDREWPIFLKKFSHYFRNKNI